MLKRIKRKIILPVIALMMLMLVACGKEGEENIICDVNLGVSEYEDIDIMGVTYEFFSNGYASIEKIKNSSAVIQEDVEYQGKTYKVIVMGHVFTPDERRGATNIQTGVFGGQYSGIEAPEILKIPDSVIYIGSSGLSYCTSKEIILPSNLQAIAGNAFEGCKNITTLEIPSTVKEMGGMSTFYNCTNLQEVIIPSDCEFIMCNATYGECESIKSAEVGGDRIGRMTFYNCYELENVVIRDGITTVEPWAFDNCPKLKKVIFPNSVTELQSGMFRSCLGLEEIVLSDNLTDVPKDLFVNDYLQVIEPEGVIIKVKDSMVDYVQSIFPKANVVAK